MADRNETNRMAPEDYRELKKQEKDEVFELLSASTQKLLSGSKLKEYADMQAKLFSHSVSNVLLIMEQDPDATWVRSYDDWRRDGVSVLKGEQGIMTLGSYRYQKRDGTMGMGSRVVKMFDVKQTAIRDFDIEGPGNSRIPDAIMNTYPVSVEVAELLDESFALYDPDDRLIRVKEGLDPATKVFVIAREQAVQILTDDGRLPREEIMAKAEFSAYVLTKHYGFDAPEIGFGEMSAAYPGKEEKDVRAELGGIKFIAERIDARVQESIELSKGNREDRGEAR